MKLARCSFRAPYECQKDWPEDCGVQAGEDGIVFDNSEEGSYQTAFFEAFPTCHGIGTFIRGEGNNIAEAEASAFSQYEKVKDCLHEQGWDRKNYTNGAGFCKQCGMFSGKVLPPTTTCTICHTPCNWLTDKHGKHYCKEHESLIKEEDKSDTQKMFERMDAQLKQWQSDRAAKQATI